MQDEVFKQLELSKSQGNDAFSRGEHSTAKEKYEHSLQLAAELKNQQDQNVTPRLVAVLFANLSATHLALNEPEFALSDADAAVKLDSKWAKAHYRRGIALAALSRFEDALAALEHAHVLDLNNAEIANKVKEMRKASHTARSTPNSVADMSRRDNRIQGVSVSPRGDLTLVDAPAIEELTQENVVRSPVLEMVNVPFAMLLTSCGDAADELNPCAVRLASLVLSSSLSVSLVRGDTDKLRGHVTVFRSDGVSCTKGEVLALMDFFLCLENDVKSGECHVMDTQYFLDWQESYNHLAEQLHTDVNMCCVSFLQPAPKIE